LKKYFVYGKGGMSCKNLDRNVKISCCDKNQKSSRVYGEFIRTFVFGDDVSLLPIVQPGGHVVFPTPTVEPSNVTYINEPGRVGLLVPKGKYNISLSLVPGIGSHVSILVNGKDPLTHTSSLNPVPYPYAQSVTSVPILNTEYLIEAPLCHGNFISIINSGTSLFALASIPNTLIGKTSIITHVRIERIDKHVN